MFSILEANNFCAKFEDAPHFTQTFAKVNGVVKTKTRLTNQWTRGETAALL